MEMANQDLSQTKCSKCWINFPTRKLLKEHHFFDHANKEVQCDECDESFTSSDEFNLHLTKLHSGRNQFECIKCPWIGFEEDKLKQHIKSKHKDLGNYECGFCGRKFDYAGKMKTHLRMNHGGKGLLHCQECEFVFVKQSSLDFHVKLKHKNSGIQKCNHCERSFTRSKILQNHISKMHEGKGLKKCEICKVICPNDTTYKKHKLNKHDESKKYKCDICVESFKLSITYKDHLSKFHDGSNLFSCEICTSKFFKASTLIKHVARKHKEKKKTKVDLNFGLKRSSAGNGFLKCYHCKMTFKTEIKLKRHTKKRHQIKTKNTTDTQNEHKDVQSEDIVMDRPNEIYDEVVVKDKSKSFKCSLCEKYFKYLSSLKSHLITNHESIGILKCEYCEKTFISDKKLKQHKKMKHEKFKNESYLKNEDSSLKCKNCEKSFTKLGPLKNHLKNIHSGAGLHNCTICKNTFFRESTLIKHLAKKHKDDNVTKLTKKQQIFNCDSCDKNFRFQSILKRHIEIVHEGKRLKCNFCSMTFTTSHNIIKHFSVLHAGKGVFKCELCEKRFLKKTTLSTHVHTMHNVKADETVDDDSPIKFYEHVIVEVKNSMKKFKRSSCEKPFDQSFHSEGKSENFKCNFCEETFKFLRKYKIHLKSTHDGQGIFECETCSKTFIKETTLQIHAMKKHHGQGEEIKKCRLCDKEFATYKRLVGHIWRYHNSMRPKCEKCAKTFKNITLLQKHIGKAHNVSKEIKAKKGKDNSRKKNSSSSNKKYKCKFCQTGFNFIQNLQRHIDTIHEGKRLKCNLCQKIFSSDNIKRHFKTNHDGNGIFKCEMCEKTFIKKKSLIDHSQKSHDNYKLDDLESRPDRYYEIVEELNKPQIGMTEMETVNENGVDHEVVVKDEISSKLHRCNSCDKTFKSPLGLKLHLEKIHDGNGLFKCDFCDMASFSEKRVQRHKKKHHKSGMEELKSTKGFRVKKYSKKKSIDFNCESCEKNFPVREHLKRHIEIVHEGKRLKCNFCSLTFTTSQILLRHFGRKHEDNGIFKCEMCDKQFINNTNLSNHCQNLHQVMKTQIGNIPDKFYENVTVKIENDQKIKDYKCNSCDEIWKTFQELKLHKKQVHQTPKKIYKNETHLKCDDQNLKCKMCEKTFKYMISFKKHLKTIHNGAGLHNCNECSNAFFRETTLEKHIKRLHNESEKMLKNDGVSCDVCDIIFSDLQLLKSHYENHNSTDIPVHNNKRLKTVGEDITERNVDTKDKEGQEIECDSTTSIIRNPNLMCNICHNYFQDKKSLLDHSGNDHLEETLQYVLTVVLKNQYAS